MEIPNVQSVQDRKYNSVNKFHTSRLYLLGRVQDRKDLRSLGLANRRKFLGSLSFSRWVSSTLLANTTTVWYPVSNGKVRNPNQTFWIKNWTKLLPNKYRKKTWVYTWGNSTLYSTYTHALGDHLLSHWSQIVLFQKQLKMAGVGSASFRSYFKSSKLLRR